MNKRKAIPLWGVAFFYVMKPSITILMCLLIGCLYGQNTIGLISYDPDRSFNGYNVLYPHNQPNVYLIDNCGQIVHSWKDEGVVPGNSAYITQEGNLVKCKRRTTSGPSDRIWAGGGGETVEIRSWENELLHQFTLNDSTFRLHHDIAPMPNGNVLMVAWQLKNYDESLEAGRDSTKMAQKEVWSESILEWNPSLDSVVWEWHAWDHLVQDYDSTMSNFGIVRDHPELIDINYDEHDGHPDWLHINAIDYNVTLDHIVLSVPYFNELWIIDHSTTTREASEHTGGNSGKGGDLLARWGNPAAFQQGDSTHQRFFFQHDVHWTNSNALAGSTDYGRIALFNNRAGPDYSTVNTLVIPWDENDQSYTFDQVEFESTIRHPGEEIRSYSTGLSSVQLLGNGNFLVCAGRWGYNYEITPDNQIVWQYITPIVRGQRGEQGDSTLTINNNITFRIERYAPEYEGFLSRDLEPKEHIELNPDTLFCNNLLSSTSELDLTSFIIYPNPSNDVLFLDFEESIDFVDIIDINGRVLGRHFSIGQNIKINITNLQTGTYLVRTPKGALKKFIKI